MTRIVAGTAGGRRLRIPPAGTRPTSARVREAVFSMLEHRLGPWSDQVVLDAFAGSGALGLEAASRGARAGLWLEQDPRAVAVLRSNAAAVGGGVTRVQCADAWTLGARPRSSTTSAPVTLLFVDPPYAEPNDRIAAWLTALSNADWLALDCTAVVERPVRAAHFSWPPHWRALTDRRYSDTVIHVGQHCGILPDDQREESR